LTYGNEIGANLHVLETTKISCSYRDSKLESFSPLKSHYIFKWNEEKCGHLFIFLRTMTVAERNWGQVMGRNVNDKVEGFCQEDCDLICPSIL
jgi:hypothetical protein